MPKSITPFTELSRPFQQVLECFASPFKNVNEKKKCEQHLSRSPKPSITFIKKFGVKELLQEQNLNNYKSDYVPRSPREVRVI